MVNNQPVIAFLGGHAKRVGDFAEVIVLPMLCCKAYLSAALTLGNCGLRFGLITLLHLMQNVDPLCDLVSETAEQFERAQATDKVRNRH